MLYCLGVEEEQKDRLSDVRTNIARHRKERRLSQAELAELVSVEGIKFFPQTVQKIENGSRTIRLDEAMALATALGVSIADLFRPAGAPVVELERAHRAALQARLRAIAATTDWLAEIENLKNVMALLGEANEEIADEDQEPWSFLVRDSARLRGESFESLLRAATNKLKAQRDGGELGSDGVDQEA